MKNIQIPQSLLKRLHCGSKPSLKSPDPAAMAEVGRLLGYASAGSSEYWNEVIDYLDLHHPGWRGYSIQRYDRPKKTTPVPKKEVRSTKEMVPLMLEVITAAGEPILVVDLRKALQQFVTFPSYVFYNALYKLRWDFIISTKRTVYGLQCAIVKDEEGDRHAA